jgi:hypothetical protein
MLKKTHQYRLGIDTVGISAASGTYFDAKGFPGRGRRLRERGLLAEEVGGDPRGGLRAGREELVLVGQHHLRVLLAVRTATVRGGHSNSRGGVEMGAVLFGGPRRGGGRSGMLGLLHEMRGGGSRRGGGRREGALRGSRGGAELRHESGADRHGRRVRRDAATGARVLRASRRGDGGREGTREGTREIGLGETRISPPFSLFPYFFFFLVFEVGFGGPRQG